MQAATAASRRASRAMERVAPAAVFAKAPLKVEAFAPITFPDRQAAEAEAATFPVDFHPPELNEGGHRVVTYYGSSDESTAAARAAHAAGVEFGPPTYLAVRFIVPSDDDTHTALISGRLSAVRQAMPNRETLAAFAEAGGRYYPVPGGAHPSGIARSRYVPLVEVPRAIQIEYESRGLAADLAKARGPQLAEDDSRWDGWEDLMAGVQTERQGAKRTPFQKLMSDG